MSDDAFKEWLAKRGRRTFRELLIGVRRDGVRYMRWPVRVSRNVTCNRWEVKRWGWQTGWEPAPYGRESFGHMPGVRAVFGWTLRIGPIHIKVGRELDSSNGSREWMVRRMRALARAGHRDCEEIADRMEFQGLIGSINARGGSDV